MSKPIPPPPPVNRPTFKPTDRIKPVRTQATARPVGNALSDNRPKPMRRGDFARMMRENRGVGL